jgi:hypothetical protein
MDFIREDKEFFSFSFKSHNYFIEINRATFTAQILASSDDKRTPSFHWIDLNGSMRNEKFLYDFYSILVKLPYQIGKALYTEEGGEDGSILIDVCTIQLNNDCGLPQHIEENSFLGESVIFLVEQLDYFSFLFSSHEFVRAREFSHQLLVDIQKLEIAIKIYFYFLRPELRLGKNNNTNWQFQRMKHKIELIERMFL